MRKDRSIRFDTNILSDSDRRFVSPVRGGRSLLLPVTSPGLGEPQRRIRRTGLPDGGPTSVQRLLQDGVFVGGRMRPQFSRDVITFPVHGQPDDPIGSDTPAKFDGDLRSRVLTHDVYTAKMPGEIAFFEFKHLIAMDRAKIRLDAISNTEADFQYFPMLYTNDMMNKITTGMRGYITFLAETANNLHAGNKDMFRTIQDDDYSSLAITFPRGRLHLIAMKDSYTGSNANVVKLLFESEKPGILSFALSDDPSLNNKRSALLGAYDSRHRTESHNPHYTCRSIHPVNVLRERDDADLPLLTNFYQSMRWASTILTGLATTPDWSTYPIPLPEEI